MLPDSSGPDSVGWRPLEAAGTRPALRAGAAGRSAMVLSAADRTALRALWKKLGDNVGVYTTEALERCRQAPAPSAPACLSALSGDAPPPLSALRRRAPTPPRGRSLSLSVPPPGPSGPSPPPRPTSSTWTCAPAPPRSKRTARRSPTR